MKKTILSGLCTLGLSSLALAGPALAQMSGPGTMSNGSSGAGMTMAPTVPHPAGKYGPGTTGLSSNGAGMHRTGMGLTSPGVSGTDAVGAGPSTPPSTGALPLPAAGAGAHNPATARPLATTGGVPR